MGTKRQQLRHHSCLGKATYRTRAEALSAIDRYKDQIIVADDTVLDAYQCAFGVHWHFGHNNRRTTPRMMIREFAAEFARS